MRAALPRFGDATSMSPLPLAPRALSPLLERTLPLVRCDTEVEVALRFRDRCMSSSRAPGRRCRLGPYKPRLSAQRRRVPGPLATTGLGGSATGQVSIPQTCWTWWSRKLDEAGPCNEARCCRQSRETGRRVGSHLPSLHNCSTGGAEIGGWAGADLWVASLIPDALRLCRGTAGTPASAT